jgi:hypothetical protein
VTACMLTGCPTPATRQVNGVPWCLAHYEAGAGIVWLEDRIDAALASEGTVPVSHAPPPSSRPRVWLGMRLPAVGVRR